MDLDGLEDDAPATNKTAKSSSRVSRGKASKKTYAEPEDSDDVPILKDDEEAANDIFEEEFKNRKGDDYESDDDNEEAPKVAKGRSKGPAKKAKTETPAKAAPKKKAPPKKKEEEPEDIEIQQILENIPTIRAPTPPSRDEGQKFDFRTHAANTGPAPLAGTKEIPEGAEGCLTGLTFVFTGQLDALGREEGQELVKRYGGKITGQPSSKTDYVILGHEAGPSKLEKIKKLGLKTINEDGLFALIRTLPAHGGSGKNAVKAEEKRQAEEKKIEQEAAKQEKEMEAERKKKEATAKSSDNPVSKPQPRLDDQLWTVKYAPTQISQICGNKTQVEKLQNWLKNWSKNAKTGFKKPGPDGSGLYRAVMIYGGPGIGKTTAAHLVAKLEGYDVVESNASDTRSKKLIETGLKGVLDTTSLMGYFAADGQKTESSKRKLVLIMDEVDGMSAGDRGGVGAMASICKKTSIPIILICNERNQPKMKPFNHVTYDLPFRKPTTDQVRSRIMTILFREGINKMIPAPVVNALIEGSNADIRRVINMISTAKLDQQAMSFDDSKKMSSAWEKNIILKPWDIAHKILGPAIWAQSNKATLNDKTELYFNDHEVSYLMFQENYLLSNPTIANEYSGKEKSYKTLELFDQAAQSISDGDLVDSMIHGPQQHWSLMPTHAIMSFVRPASFVYGSTGSNRMQFTNWLGNNSKQGLLL
jgi:replication factor C subunit 1